MEIPAAAADKHFGAHVVTNCEAETDTKDVPLHGIVRKTEVMRTTEVSEVPERRCESRGSSDAELCMPKAVDFDDKATDESRGIVDR